MDREKLEAIVATAFLLVLILGAYIFDLYIRT